MGNVVSLQQWKNDHKKETDPYPVVTFFEATVAIWRFWGLVR
jgi:hypothetical protein